jgi:hypothetical protein
MVAVLVVVVLRAALPVAATRAASMAVVDIFHASCSHFSVDVTVRGLTKDHDGWDRFRYEVVDGRGSLLYTEDSVRMVGTEDRAFVVNMPFVTDAKANPIRFRVIDTDMFARPVATVLETTFDSVCFAGAKPASRLEELLPTGIKARMLAASPLYTEVNGMALPLTVEQGREFTVLYRSTDGQWVALYVGGENLVWVKARDVDLGDGGIFRLSVRPDRIDRSQQVTGAVVPGVPVGTGRTTATLRMRAAPALTGQTLLRIPARTEIAIYGRTANNQWYLVSYNGIAGWSSARYIRLLNVTLSALPVLQ